MNDTGQLFAASSSSSPTAALSAFGTSITSELIRATVIQIEHEEGEQKGETEEMKMTTSTFSLDERVIDRIRLQLHKEANKIRDELQKITDTQRKTQEDIERAAKALSIRTLELETKDLDLNIREEQLSVLETRAKSVKYSMIDENKLHIKSKALDLRAERISKDEEALMDKRIDIVRRQVNIREKERLINQVQNELHEKQIAIDNHSFQNRKHVAQILLHIEKERKQFWKKRQVISEHVAILMNDIVKEIQLMNKQLTQLACIAKNTVHHITNQVNQFESELSNISSFHSSSDGVT